VEANAQIKIKMAEQQRTVHKRIQDSSNKLMYILIQTIKRCSAAETRTRSCALEMPNQRCKLIAASRKVSKCIQSESIPKATGVKRD
jgi:hypothetical protein